MRLENEHALGPLDVFPTDVAAAADWRNLLFGGWWSWLEKWGKLASIILGIYYLYLVGRWAITTLFSLKVLYEEHEFRPNLWWGLGPGQDVFPMRFYRRWRWFKQHFSQAGGHEVARAPPVTVPHEYLALNEMEIPQLPRRNRTMSNVYPVLPHQKHTSVYDNGPPWSPIRHLNVKPQQMNLCNASGPWPLTSHRVPGRLNRPGWSTTTLYARRPRRPMLTWPRS